MVVTRSAKMPRKRKASLIADPHLTPDIKRHKHRTNLLELPTEVLNMILLEVIPDPQDFRWTSNDDFVTQMFTEPILQVCKTIRQICLELIDKECVWVQLSLPTLDMIWDLRNSYYFIPLVPLKFKQYISSKSPTIRLEFRGTNLPSRSTRSFDMDANTLIIPYNFEILLRIFHILSDFTDDDDFTDDGGEFKLHVAYNNIKSHSQKIIQDLSIQAISTMHDIDGLTYEFDGKPYVPSDKGECIRAYWNIDNLTERAMDYLQRTENLSMAGHAKEASIMLIFSDWLSDEAEDILPPRYSWMDDITDADDTDDDTSPDLEQLIIKGNKLRKLLNEIEHRACLAYADLYSQYGHSWAWNLEDSVYAGDERFLGHFSFSWIGFSLSELARMHYQRAYMKEAKAKVLCPLYRISKAKPSQKIIDKGSVKKYKEWIKAAAVEMYFACMLDPDNERYRTMYAREKEQLGSQQSKSAETVAKKRFVLITDNPIQQNTGRIIWAGDQNLLGVWGRDNRLIESHRKAQRGLGVLDNLDEWAEKVLTHDEEVKFRQQGAKFVKEHTYDD